MSVLESPSSHATIDTALPLRRSGRGHLVLSGIDKNFDGSDVPALRGVSVTTEPGEFVVVVGPSGCGKSTLLNVAAGMYKPDAGSVTLDGQRVDGPAPIARWCFKSTGCSRGSRRCRTSSSG